MRSSQLNRQVSDQTSLATSFRNVILNHLLRVFAQYGFRKSSMRDLADAMGISRQALYNRYGSKEAVFAWATKTLIEQSVAATLAALEDDSLAVPDRLAGRQRKSCVPRRPPSAASTPQPATSSRAVGRDPKGHDGGRGPATPPRGPSGRR